MGGAKRRMEERDGLEAYARGLLLKTGAIQECELHPSEFFEQSGDPQPAYKLANHEITTKKLVLPSGVSTRDFTDIIKSENEIWGSLEICSYYDRIASRDDQDSNCPCPSNHVTTLAIA